MVKRPIWRKIIASCDQRAMNLHTRNLHKLWVILWPVWALETGEFWGGSVNFQFDASSLNLSWAMNCGPWVWWFQRGLRSPRTLWIHRRQWIAHGAVQIRRGLWILHESCESIENWECCWSCEFAASSMNSGTQWNPRHCGSHRIV